MAVLLQLMAQTNSYAKDNTDEVNPAIFHDFLGRGCASDSSQPAVNPSAGGNSRTLEASHSASVGASSSGGRGRVSATSDLGSEKQVANHFVGIPVYGPRSDLTGTEISNRFAGNKRSNSDSSFMASSRDGFPQAGPNSLDGLHSMKMLRDAGGDHPRRSHDETLFFGMHSTRPTQTSLTSQPPPRTKMDASVSKWDLAIPLNVCPAMQYPPPVGQITPVGCQVPSSRFKDSNAGPSVISQAAADEGSRTGIRGSGILSSLKVCSGASDGNPSEVLLSGSKQKSDTHNSEPESFTSRSQHGLSAACRQMTIFYGGQAHVFDDVHPKKADMIMALAGSNGGSWSTAYASKSATQVPGESYIPAGDNETGTASNFASSQQFRRRLSIVGTSSHRFGSGDQTSRDQTSMPSGAHQGSTLLKDGKIPVQEVETRTEDKEGGVT